VAENPPSLQADPWAHLCSLRFIDLLSFAPIACADDADDLWVQFLKKFLRDQHTVEELLQLFQGAVLAYLITGDPEPGTRSLARIFRKQGDTRTSN
jgi:hypothetical protein